MGKGNDLEKNDGLEKGSYLKESNDLKKNDGLEKGSYLEEKNYRERDRLGWLEDKIVAAAVGAEVARYIEKYPGQLEGKIGVRNASMEQKWDWRAISPNPDWALALSKGNLLAQLQKKAAISKAAVGKAAAGIEEAGRSVIRKAAAGIEEAGRSVIGKAAAGIEEAGRSVIRKTAAGIEEAGRSVIGKTAAGIEEAGRSVIGKAAAGIEEAGGSVRRKAEAGRDTVGKREDGKTEKLLQQRSMATREQKRWLQEKQMYAAISGNIDPYRSFPQSFESGRIPAADAQKLACRKWQPTQFPKNNVDSILPGALRY
ncbi:MAG: hypothetical protein HFH39_08800 [Lachnospiraceae bacterium]|nr:hypothetical protein [Lachnospiraceae bacterium]